MKPCLLIASPQMKDPFFERAVVLVWHHDDDGAIGVVINRPLPHKLVDVLQDSDQIDTSAYVDTTVSWGGPVETMSGTVITRSPLIEHEGWSLEAGLGVTRSQEALQRLLHTRSPILMCLGYAGWGPGQLDTEIERGGWLWTDLDASIIFDVPVDHRYDSALANLGLSSSMVWMQPIDE